MTQIEPVSPTTQPRTVKHQIDAPWINVNDRLPDNARWVLGARRDDDVREMCYRRNWMQGYWDKPSIDSPDPIYWREMPEVPQVPKEKEWSGALDGTDYADRLRWLLSQAERVVTVEAEDRRAVDRACKLLAECDNGFDRVRG